jgi:hypothetical protein
MGLRSLLHDAINYFRYLRFADDDRIHRAIKPFNVELHSAGLAMILFEVGALYETEREKN